MIFNKARFRSSASSVVLLSALLAVSPATAQSSSADDNADEVEEVVVTGSRIRRSEFTSAAPLQVLDPSAARQIGVTNITDLMQRSTVVNGTQLDGTLNTNAGNSNASEASPIGGVGSSNVDLRGLGPERTLILVNGRRMGLAGVRGAPAQPDMNMLPLSMLKSVEVITEGASSVYGADAVAGVVNLILRDDFEGFDFSVSSKIPTHAGGVTSQYSFITGAQGDRGRFTLAGEYYNQRRISTGQRDFSKCLSSIEEDADGNIYDFCADGFFDNVALVIGQPNTSGVWFAATPGSTNIGVPNWSSPAAIAAPTAPGTADPGPNSISRRVFHDYYTDQDERRRSDLVQPVERFSIVSNASYDLNILGDAQLYNEFYYLNRTTNNIAAMEQVFPTIPGQIAQRDADGNVVGLVDNPLNPFDVDATPIVTLENVPQNKLIEVSQFRAVGGLRGNLEGDMFRDKNWTYDVYASYDRGVGFQNQPVLFEPHLLLATQTSYLDAEGNLKCGFPVTSVAGFETVRECVPVNFFAPSIYGANGNEGEFATQAEADYLIGNRTNRTVTQQFMMAGFITGELFDIPGGDTVATAMGVEYRKDSISSQNGIVGVQGLNSAENPLQEGETMGSRSLFEMYAEVNVPFITGMEGMELLNFEGAARYTQETNFGTATTVRARLQWVINDNWSFSGSYGTSFRAPNLREQFLAAQGGGIGGGNDPCRVPTDALVNGVYDASQDTRAPIILDNCRADGADPTVLGSTGTVTIPISVGGSTDLEAETSRSYTATATWNETFADTYDFSMAVSYYDIRIKNTVEELDPAEILRRCYNDEPNLASPFCGRITRPTGNPAFDFPTLIDASFVNIGLQTAKGMDFNTRLRTEVDDFFMKEPLSIGWVTATSVAFSQNEQVFADSPADDNIGEIGSPKYRFTNNLFFGVGDFELVLSSRYIHKTQQDDTDPFTDNALVVGNILTRDVDYTKSVWYHDISGTYRMDEASTFTLGISNIFNTKPPRIDAGEGPNRNNAVTSAGYDLFGTSVFFSVNVSF